MPIKIYLYLIDEYINDIKKLITNNNNEVLKEDYYEWNIYYLSNSNNYNTIDGPEFTLCDNKW